MNAIAPIAALLLLLAAGGVRSQDDSVPSIASGAVQPNAPVASGPPAAASPDSPDSPGLAVVEPASLPPQAGMADGPTPPDPRAKSSEELDFLQRSHLILAKLLENHREVDPFGMVMDPANAKAAPFLAEQYQVEDEPQALSVSSLKSALLSLPITGVYPQREQIVIGARTFSAGGQFGMKHQDLTIRLRFEGIRGGELFFKDMETQEVTSIPFNPRPAEFEPLTKSASRTPGSGIVPMGDLYIAN